MHKTSAIKNWKRLRHQLRRMRRELKCRSKKHRRIRAKKIHKRKIDRLNKCHVKEMTPNCMTAPLNFSFIDNTTEFLDYMYICKEHLHHKEKILIDISEVDIMTPDAIALLVAFTRDRNFHGRYGLIEGNAPQKAELQKLFVESGFYKFVNTSSEMKKAQKREENLLHKESHTHVQPVIAKEACLHGTKHVFGNENPIPSLYEMLIEAMSNTNNHASNSGPDKIKWWLYTYNHPDGSTFYSFVDLGVGIFDSIPVKRYKRLLRATRILHNADLVDDLLDGKIKSREAIDNDMRGKGIPQIALNSKENIFKRAYIISNNVKIDLKTRNVEKLGRNFQGTFLYWVLSKTN